MWATVWRPEYLHPFSVHFAFSLLIIGTLCRFFGIVFSWRAKQFVSDLDRGEDSNATGFLIASGQFMTFLGVISVWIAYATGRVAFGQSSIANCFPDMLKAHTDYGLKVALIFTCISASDVLTLFLRKSLLSIEFLRRFLTSRSCRILIAIIAIGTSALLIYVERLGNTLTHAQGAVPGSAEQCPPSAPAPPK